MIVNFKKRRNKLQALTFLGLPLVILGGWFYPLIGFLLLGCMLGAIGVALYKGRAWCDWMCPRGSFYDLFIKKFSKRKEIPTFFKKPLIRALVICLLLSVIGLQVYIHWGDLEAIGLALVKVLTITTTVGVVLGLIYQERIWCHICPMGTFGNILSRGKYPLVINDTCNSCKVCSKVCPMQLKPYIYKGTGVVSENDCIKCSSCVISCPKRALGFELKKAA
ncbi:MAG: 4Fe-4S binding protein [Thermodesulfovibrionales bacterium]|nr:4Fe-4S binding protein [Thermodesulfovibrionales bacterium]